MLNHGTGRCWVWILSMLLGCFVVQTVQAGQVSDADEDPFVQPFIEMEFSLRNNPDAYCHRYVPFAHRMTRTAMAYADDGVIYRANQRIVLRLQTEMIRRVRQAANQNKPCL